jgi:hypothetical protein
LEDLGVEQDVNEDVEIMKGQHIKEEVHKTTAKALYRRGMCKSALNDTTSALVDFQMALIYMPNDKVLYFILLKFWK